uniref:Uncharacterized protein n=1 Tax=Glossina austeni TaxID=7395 RepID=A0A1A9VA14_GLOAU
MTSVCFNYSTSLTQPTSNPFMSVMLYAFKIRHDMTYIQIATKRMIFTTTYAYVQMLTNMFILSSSVLKAMLVVCLKRILGLFSNTTELRNSHLRSIYEIITLLHPAVVLLSSFGQLEDETIKSTKIS